MLTKWNRRHLEMARLVATWSKDPRTKVGCVIVGGNQRDLAIGYNGFPPGIRDTDDRLNNRDLKNALTQHAERNALDNALFDTRGATIVTTRFPCHECAKSMVTKGITRVVAPNPPADPEWARSSDLSRVILHEGGIEVVYYETPEEEYRRAIEEGTITGAAP